MSEYLKRVLELVRPYRFRFVLGLLCGFLSGALAFLPALSLKIAVDTVFPSGSPANASAQTRGKQGSPINPSAPQPELGAASQLPAGATLVGTNSRTAQSLSVSNSADVSVGSATASKGVLGRINLPAPLKRKLDEIQNWFRPPMHPSRLRLVLAIALIPAAMLIRGVLGYLNVYMLSWVGIRAANDLRVKLFNHLLHLPMGFFGKTSTGGLMAITEGGMNVNNTINGSFAIIIREPISIVMLVGTLVAMQPLLSLATLVVFPVCLVPVIVYGRKLRKSHTGIYTKFGHVSQVMHEAFTGMRVIKAYNLEATVVEQFRRAADAVTGFFMRSVRASEVPGPTIEFIGSLGVALIFAYFAFVQPGSAPLSDLLAFFYVVFSLYQPIKNLSRLHSQLTLARASVDPIYNLLATKTSLPEPADPKPLKGHGAPIRFEDVTFSYGEKPVLQGINLTIEPGQMVALVGLNGSGKTSMANLLLRFYDPQKGAILIGDTDIRAVASRELRDNIAVVTQTTILFNDTIRNNIALGRPGATTADIEAAAKHAYADGFILDRPQRYDSPVGEKGANLSGGQQQRVAIARAILRNAPILILDEATSALDSESQSAVQAALEELMEGRTTICIAHRLSTIQKADQIVVLDKGRIVETGTHAELIRAGGIYSRLYELSAGGLIDAPAA
jgi:subfamily B ATP-binding cassette protein MsbA